MLIGTSQAQIIQTQPRNDIDSRFIDEYGDSTSVFNKEIQVELSDETFYEDYKIVDHNLDTTYIDTTLTIKKHHTFNYLRKETLELMPFHNPGQTFNDLAYTFKTDALYPKIGASKCAKPNKGNWVTASPQVYFITELFSLVRYTIFVSIK